MDLAMLRKRCSLAWLGIMAFRWLLDEEILMPAASVSMRVLLESFYPMKVNLEFSI